MLQHATHLEVCARVRYWEDATVDWLSDDNGTRIPLRHQDAWCPVIRLADGVIDAWPGGVRAAIHYQVCDEGRYWLCDASGSRIATWRGSYVPDRFLCHGKSGHGDAIILNVEPDGSVRDWRAPTIDDAEWAPYGSAPDADIATPTRVIPDPL